MSTLDLPPTILETLGQPFGDLRLQGRVLPKVSGRVGRELIAESQIGASRTQAPVNLLAVVDGDVKCILNKLEKDRFGRPAKALEAYDLAVDPAERSPLTDPDPRIGLCRSRLKDWLDRGAEAMRRKGRTERQLPPEEVRRLRSLGYLQ